MSPRCDLDLEDSNSNNNNKKSTWHSGSWCCITIPNLVTKCSVIQKILSRQTFTDILNLRCDLDLERSNPIFPKDTPDYQTKFGYKPTSSWKDTTEIVIFWLYKPSPWPWLWTQWNIFSAWLSVLWCCITIPGLVAKYSVVQKILSGQTCTCILNLRCDLDLERSNPIFSTGYFGLWCCTIKSSLVGNRPAV